MTPLMIVEDDALVGATMCRWLEGTGYSVSLAGNADEALLVAQETQPGIAVCDVGLPGAHDGLWLMERLLHDRADTAIIIATGRNDLPPTFTLKPGMISYLLKPFGRDDLRAAVASADSWRLHASTDARTQVRLELEAKACRQSLRDRVMVEPVTNDDAAWTLWLRLFTNEDREAALRVAATTDALASNLDLKEDEATAVHWAALFHRLGRLTIPDGVTAKPGGLSDVERRIVDRSPSEAFEALVAHPFLAEPGYLLRSIREREDGLGHPDGLVGAAIPLGSRVLAVAEALEAITHDQPHRPGRSPADAVLELLRCAGTQFDADVVHAAVDQLARGSAR